MTETPGQVAAGYSFNFDSDCTSLSTIATVASTYMPDDGPIGYGRLLILIGGSPLSGRGRGRHPRPGRTSHNLPPFRTTQETSLTSDGGLSRSANIGIKVAVPHVVILLTAAFFLVLWARRKRYQQHTAAGGGMSWDLAPGSKPELEASRGPLLQWCTALHTANQNCMPAGTANRGVVQQWQPPQRRKATG